MRISRKAQWIIFGILNGCILFLLFFSPIYLHYMLEAPLVETGDCSSLVLCGMYCQLCGATHAVKYLYELDFLKSLEMNAMILPTILMVLGYDVAVIVGLIRGGDRKPLIRWWMIVAYFAVFTLYTIMRNVALLDGYDPTGFILNEPNEPFGVARLMKMFPFWLEKMKEFFGFAL